jgi:uncharacterized surface protein with fasciclin (FAS1) repeats
MKRRTAAVAMAVPLAVAAPIAAGVASASSSPNIVQVAASNKQFSTLVTAVKAAGLVKALSGGELTVFAPTNAAFAKLPKGTLVALLKPQNKAALVRVLTYHVVPGARNSSWVVTHRKLRTLQGQTISVKVVGNNVFLNGTTKITTANIAASNGYIHVVNKVLIPAGLHLK